MSAEEINQLANRKHRLWHLLEHVQWLSMRYARQVHARTSRHIAEAGRGQGRVLTELARANGISQKDLTAIMGMRQQSLAELLKKLEGKGLVTRTHSQHDRRVMMAHITEAGRAEAKRLGGEENNDERLAFLNCLSEEEQKNLEDYLTRIACALEETVEPERNARANVRERLGRRDHAPSNSRSESAVNPERPIQPERSTRAERPRRPTRS